MPVITIPQAIQHLRARDRRAQEQLDLLKADEARTRTALKQATEISDRVAARMLREKLADEIAGNTIGGVRWFGDPAEHLEHLEKLAKEFGENSKEVDQYINDQRELARTGVHPNPYPAIGHVGNPIASAGTPAGKLDARARKLMTESGGTLNYGEALSRACAENPELYEQHVAGACA
jgi:hypothetical protein